MRLQAERHAGEKAKLEKQKDAAMVTVGGVYLCERASHKKVQRIKKSKQERQARSEAVARRPKEVSEWSAIRLTLPQARAMQQTVR